MKVRVCPNCGQHNPPDAWNCANPNCGETLSVSTQLEVQDDLVDFQIPAKETKSRPSHLLDPKTQVSSQPQASSAPYPEDETRNEIEQIEQEISMLEDQYRKLKSQKQNNEGILRIGVYFFAIAFFVYNLTQNLGPGGRILGIVIPIIMIYGIEKGIKDINEKIHRTETNIWTTKKKLTSLKNS